MKALFVNGSPRKNWNTHKMLESAMKGAADSGAECELVNLYDYNFKGCVSCFACKLKNSKTQGLCAVHDELRPVLAKALASDIIVMGTPVYFGFPTGMLRSFMERFLFPVMTYSVDEEGRPIRNIDKKIYSATIFTMNCPEDIAAKVNYPAMIESNSFGLRIVLGYTENLCSYETLQFSDYSRYEANNYNEAQRRERHEKVFPQDLQKAYELGTRLVHKAKGGE